MKKVHYFLFLALLVGCKSNLNPKEIFIDEKSRNNVNLSEIFSKVQVIKLQTDEKSMLSNIWKVSIDYNRIFCFEKKLQAVYIFDRDGVFINKTARIGKGPGEILSCIDFTLNRDKSQLEILDNLSKKILVYDYNGKLVGERSGVPRSGFEKLDSHKYIGYSYNIATEVEPKTIAFNDQGEIVKDYNKLSELTLQRNTYTNLTMSSTGEIYLIPVYDFSLFSFEPNLEVNEICKFVFNNSVPPKYYELSNQNEAKRKLKESGAPYLIKNLQIVDELLYFQYLFGKEFGHFFGDMKNDRIQTVNDKYLANDLFFNEPFYVCGTFEKGLITAYNPRKLIELVEAKDIDEIIADSKTKVENYAQFKTMIKATKPYDNPLLILYYYQ